MGRPNDLSLKLPLSMLQQWLLVKSCLVEGGGWLWVWLTSAEASKRQEFPKIIPKD